MRKKHIRRPASRSFEGFLYLAEACRAPKCESQLMPRNLVARKNPLGQIQRFGARNSQGLCWWTGRDLNPRPYGTSVFPHCGYRDLPSGRFSRPAATFGDAHTRLIYRPTDPSAFDNAPKNLRKEGRGKLASVRNLRKLLIASRVVSYFCAEVAQPGRAPDLGNQE